MGRPWLIAVLLVGITRASSPAPASFEPGQWLGDDGNWSTVAVEVGSPAQKVNILVSTTLSELWVVGPGGCLPSMFDPPWLDAFTAVAVEPLAYTRPHRDEPVCDAARGGVFTPSTSKSWRSLNAWELGLQYLGYGGNGDYGREMVSGHDPMTGGSFTISNISVAAINTTDYYQGLVGLGITRGNFNDGEVVDSPLTGAGITIRSIPSVSYGYTAGAYYRNTPASLTLGGFDTARHVSHNTKFTLTQTDNLPCPLVRGIEFVTKSDGGGSDKQENLKTEILSDWGESFLAVIDSTTPYLWLPDWLCDRFTEAFGMTYNETFDLYTVTNDQYHTYSSAEFGYFTFSLSSLDNYNDLGTPLEVPGVVNITVSSQAFLSLLQYPFMGEAIQYGDPAIPYFSLRKSRDNSTVIFGRAFLQESYLITRYDEAAFSIHSAVFPEDPISNANVVAVEQGANSPYAPNPTVQESGKLRRGQIAGIAVGAALAFLALLAAAWFLYRRRRRAHHNGNAEMAKTYRTPSSSASDISQNTLGQLISRIMKRRQPPIPAVDDGKIEEVRATEAPNSQIHELPVPIRPVELDGYNEEDDVVGEELGDSGRAGAYEAARQRMERQLQGPVPEYSPPLDGAPPPPEKAMYYPDEQPRESPSAITSGAPLLRDGGVDMDSPSTPSNAPEASWTRRFSGIPSPITLPGDGTTSSEVNLSPASPSSFHPSEEAYLNQLVGQPLPSPMTPAILPLQAPSPVMCRSPITASNIVCLGPLPENLQLSGRHSPPHMIHTNDRGVTTPSPSHASQPPLETLGSDYTEAEERLAELTPESRVGLEVSSDHIAMHQALARWSMLPRQDSAQSTDPGSPSSGERVGSSTDLVHVPQMAAQRYSWEEGR